MSRISKVCFKIVQYLDTRSLLQVGLVCRAWRGWVTQELWGRPGLARRLRRGILDTWRAGQPRETTSFDVLAR